MAKPTPLSRRSFTTRFAGAIAGIGTLTGCTESGQVTSEAESDTQNRPASKSTALPETQTPEEVTPPHYTAYLPADFKKRPVRMMTEVSIFHPKTAMTSEWSRPVGWFFEDRLRYKPEGVELSNITRVVESLGHIVIEGDFGRSEFILDITKDGGQQLDTYKGYEFFQHNNDLYAVSDGVFMKLSSLYKRPTLSTLRTMILNREMPGVVGEQSSTFDRMMSAISTTYWADVRFAPWKDGFYGNLQGVPDSLVGIAQYIEEAEPNFRAITKVLVDGDADANLDAIRSAVTDNRNFGWLEYDSPSVSAQGSMTTISETKSPNSTF